LAFAATLQPAGETIEATDSHDGDQPDNDKKTNQARRRISERSRSPRSGATVDAVESSRRASSR
jgi:hypothetical protein